MRLASEEDSGRVRKLGPRVWIWCSRCWKTVLWILQQERYMLEYSELERLLRHWCIKTLKNKDKTGSKKRVVRARHV